MSSPAAFSWSRLESKLMANGLELDRIVVVLVRARNPNNIGAVARAMHDFGFRTLRLVNDYEVPFRGCAICGGRIRGAGRGCDVR